MKLFIENYHKNDCPWFSSIHLWSVNSGGSFGREIWICCYGVPAHAWNFSTFHAIGQHWGEVVQTEEDTVKVARLDIGKVKIVTTFPAAINHQMILMVSSKSFIIRVSEEQAVLICNTDFQCQCVFHEGDSIRKSSGRSSLGSEATDIAAGTKEDILPILRIIEYKHGGLLSNQVADGSICGFDDGGRETNQAHISRVDNVDKALQTRSTAARSNDSSSSMNEPHNEVRPSAGCEESPSNLIGGRFLEPGVREEFENHNEVVMIDAVQETPEWGEVNSHGPIRIGFMPPELTDPSRPNLDGFVREIDGPANQFQGIQLEVVLGGPFDPNVRQEHRVEDVGPAQLFDRDSHRDVLHDDQRGELTLVPFLDPHPGQIELSRSKNQKLISDERCQAIQQKWLDLEIADKSKRITRRKHDEEVGDGR
ncbi:hypothetical protein Dimus_021415 [Dionaea muscipula]